MVDKKIDRPIAPVEWDLPDAPDDLGGPDKSFHDDHVGGRLKSDARSASPQQSTGA
jgi:hypothetical protein